MYHLIHRFWLIFGYHFLLEKKIGRQLGRQQVGNILITIWIDCSLSFIDLCDLKNPVQKCKNIKIPSRLTAILVIPFQSRGFQVSNWFFQRIPKYLKIQDLHMNSNGNGKSTPHPSSIAVNKLQSAFHFSTSHSGWEKAVRGWTFIKIFSYGGHTRFLRYKQHFYKQR